MKKRYVILTVCLCFVVETCNAMQLSFTETIEIVVNKQPIINSMLFRADCEVKQTDELLLLNIRCNHWKVVGDIEQKKITKEMIENLTIRVHFKKKLIELFSNEQKIISVKNYSELSSAYINKTIADKSKIMIANKILNILPLFSPATTKLLTYGAVVKERIFTNDTRYDFTNAVIWDTFVCMTKDNKASVKTLKMKNMYIAEKLQADQVKRSDYVFLDAILKIKRGDAVPVFMIGSKSSVQFYKKGRSTLNLHFRLGVKPANIQKTQKNKQYPW